MRLAAFSGALIWTLVLASAAFADTLTQVTVSAVYVAMIPYIAAVFAGLVIAILTLVWQYARSHIKLLQTQQAADIEAKAMVTFQQALANAAGRFLASKEGSVAGMKVDVHSPGIAAEVQNVQQMIPDAIQRINISPDQVQSVIAKGIVGKFGQMQATVPPSSAPTVVAGPNAETANVVINSTTEASPTLVPAQ